MGPCAGEQPFLSLRQLLGQGQVLYLSFFFYIATLLPPPGVGRAG